jgi:LPS sulfotransferase NodH
MSKRKLSIRRVPLFRGIKSSYSNFIHPMLTNIYGSKEYTRFIILSRSRTGSNFLRGLLNAHSQVITYSEMFKNNRAIEWGFPGYNDTKATIALFQNDPVQFLEKKVFTKYPRKIAAVGFKLFYYHAKDRQWNGLWSYLKEDTGLKIIHLKRRNILETHLSRQRAMLTDNWANISGERQEQPAIALDYAECLKDFKQTRDWEREYDLYFSKHPMLEVFYEDLSQSYHAEIQRVQEFLGLCFEPVAPKTFKQGILPLSKSITNFAELKEKFSGSAWEEFFTDD